MATRSSGDHDAPVLVLGPKAGQLRQASAFGLSMTPFIRSGAELALERVPAAQIRPGDIISYASPSGASVTHRVVKVLKAGKDVSFLTKGDNRPDLDPLVHEEQVLGRVTRIDQTGIRTIFWRLAGSVTASVSYGAYRTVETLAKSRVNHFRHVLVKKGYFPKIKIRAFSGGAANPLRCIGCILSWFERLKLQGSKWTLLSRGIRVSYSSEPSVESLTNVWNDAFPGYETNPERFGRLIKNRSFFLVRSHSRLIGWAAVRTDASVGHMDIIALNREGWDAGADRVLFDEMVRWMKKEKTGQICLNPHPVPKHPEGVPMTPLLVTASKFGFEPAETSAEWLVTDDRYCIPRHQELFPSLEIRDLEEKDAGAVQDFFDRNGRASGGHLLPKVRRSSSVDGERILLAFLEGVVIGFCRFVPDDRLTSCESITWAWALFEPQRKRGYLVRLLVDRGHQRRGLGTILADLAFRALFENGCREVSLVALQNGTTERFYKRFGFVEQGRFLKLKKRSLE